MRKTAFSLAVSALILLPLGAQQPNTPNATAVWAGVDHPAGGTGPIIVNFTSTVVAFDVIGVPNSPWAWAASPGPALAAGIPTPFGLLDLNIIAGLNIWADGFGFSTGSLLDLLANTGPVGQTNFVLPNCNAYMTATNTHQVLIADPAAAAGLNFTAATTYTGTCGNFFLLPNGDDTSVQVTQGPFCLTTEFYDVSYGSIFANSNGNVSFGAANFDFTESQAEFDAQQARACPAWDDLNPGAGGVNTYTETTAGWRVDWVAVPEFATANANTFSVAYDCNTGAITFSYGAMALVDAIVGITPGNGLAAPVTTFASLLPAGCGGAFAHAGAGLESINAVYAAGFDLGGCAALTFQPAVFGGSGSGMANSYAGF